MSNLISPIQLPGGSAVVFSDNVVSLDQRMTDSLSQLSENVAQRQSALADLAGERSDDPLTLVRVQAELANFHTDLSLHSTLARKAVAVVETLVKS